jgi:hypothetical protein
MPRVTMHFVELPMSLSVTFIEGSQKLGPIRRYADSSYLYDILRAAKAPLEDVQAVEFALLSRRPDAVTLNLTSEQYDKLKRGK